ncbi:hypothetical protein BJY52DRAFT_1123545, partial [Lactarius psammicola]
CGHFGHIARVCPNDAVEYGYATRAPPPGRGLNVASLPPVKCYRCGGPNHMARDCLAPPYAVTEDMNGAKPPVKTCYRCKKDGHVRLLLSIRSCRLRFSYSFFTCTRL